MAVAEPEGTRRRRAFLLLLLALIAILLSLLGAYLVVISQNPASKVSQPGIVYGLPPA
jgi:cell division septal protein FtsQ